MELIIANDIGSLSFHIQFLMLLCKLSVA